MSKKPTLAIISTYDELCGIASYTNRLVDQLSPYYEVTVFDLDQRTFRGTSKSAKLSAEKKMKTICSSLGNFDVVNIQLEHSTIAKNPKLILNRLSRFIDESPKVSITFHTVFNLELFDGLWVIFKRGNIKELIRKYTSNKRNYSLLRGVDALVLKNQKIKPLSVIVHTKRDAMYLKSRGYKYVFDHPLSYYSKKEAEELRESVSISEFPLLLDNINQGDVLIGVFGFIANYKGIGIALKALKLLPTNFHLAIFGGLHPNSITNTSLNPELASIINEILPENNVEINKARESNISISLKESTLMESHRYENNIFGRVHFLGNLTEKDFARGMVICNVVLLPYFEVGQSSSGPLSIATDLGAKIIASRTQAFIEFDKYNPKRINMFDIGNFIHLSQLIKVYTTESVETTFEEAKFTSDTNISTYKKAFFYDSNDFTAK